MIVRGKSPRGFAQLTDRLVREPAGHGVGTDEAISEPVGQRLADRFAQLPLTTVVRVVLDRFSSHPRACPPEVERAAQIALAETKLLPNCSDASRLTSDE